MSSLVWGLFGCFAGDSVLLLSYGLTCGGIALFGFGGLWIVMVYWFGFCWLVVWDGLGDVCG